MPPDRNQEIKDAQAAERAAFVAYKAKVKTFVDTLEETIANEPNAGGLSAAQADEILAEAKGLTTEIDAANADGEDLPPSSSRSR